MFSIQPALQQPQQPAQQDFSIRAYRRLDAIRSRAFLPNVVAALGGLAGRFMRHLLEAMYESRRKQAIAVLGHYEHLIDLGGQPQSPVSQKPTRAREGDDVPFRTGGFADQAVYGMRIRCSITGAPCDGDRAHLCVEWGCARKGGISPVSHENA
jgi:hypothetical protein